MSVEATDPLPNHVSTLRRSVRRAGMPSSRKKALIAAAFLAPNFLGFLAFTFVPVLVSFWMSFTNWSLKPAVKFKFVGLLNYSDLMGVQPIGHGNAVVLAIYLACVVGFFLAAFGALWGNMEDWKGTRLGSAIIALTGIVFVGIGFAHSSDGIVLGGLVAVLCGLAGSFKESDFSIGFGVTPGVILAVSSAGLWTFASAMGANYAPNDNYFYQFLYNTVYLMLGIPLSIAGSLGMALLLNEELPTGPARERMVASAICVVLGVVLGGLLWAFDNPDAGLVCGIFWLIAALGIGFNVVVFRTLFYLPTFTAGVALMILWKALYNPKTGPIDVGLQIIFNAFHIHVSPPQWLADVAWAKSAMIIMGVWTGIGGTNMLLYLAGLSNVPKELIDAANVDGAGAWTRFRHVVWPQLAPTTFFISIMSIIGGLQGGFDQARVMTQGGPAGSTTTLAYYIYTKAFSELNMGYAAAISWILFLIVFIATAINWKFGKGLDSE
jgi:ABC-type sugar transport system permease subunit